MNAWPRRYVVKTSDGGFCLCYGGPTEACLDGDPTCATIFPSLDSAREAIQTLYRVSETVPELGIWEVGPTWPRGKAEVISGPA